jgi:hypothetical protein
LVAHAEVPQFFYFLLSLLLTSVHHNWRCGYEHSYDIRIPEYVQYNKHMHIKLIANPKVMTDNARKLRK